MNRLLYGCDGSVQDKHRYALAAVKAAEEAFDHVDFVGLAEKDDFRPAGNEDQYFRGPLCGLLAVCPEEKPRLAAKVMQTFVALLDKGDLNTCVALAPHLYRDLLAPAEYRMLVERILDLRARYTGPLDMVHKACVRTCLQSLEDARAEWTPPVAVPRVVRMLLTPESRELATLAGGVTSARSLTPQRPLLDGSTLWVGMLAAGTEPQAKAGNRDGAALLRLDICTGKLQALRFGEQGQKKLGEQAGAAGSLIPMCRWGDRICVSQAGRAIYLFPAGDQQDGGEMPTALRLTKADGLLDTGFVGMAGLVDDLYIAVPNLLLKWNMTTRAIAVIANTEEQIGDSAMKGERSFLQLWEDAGRKRLFAVSMVPQRNEAWRMNLADSTWQRLPFSGTNFRGQGPFIIGVYPWDQDRVWLFNPCGTNSEWILFDAKQERFDEVAKPGESWWAPWLDVPKEALEVSDPGNVKANLSMGAYTGAMVDAVPWESGTIAIARVGKSWEIRHYTRQTNAVSTSLAWAPLVQGTGTVAAAQAPP